MAQPDAHLTGRTSAPSSQAEDTWTQGQGPNTEKPKEPGPAPAGGSLIPGGVGFSLQGWPVLRVWRGAVYVRIPRDLQKPTGGCSCQYCVMHPDEPPMWDTLGIPIDEVQHHLRVTWTLHAPEWKQGEKVKP